jgi:hypothetical protein
MEAAAVRRERERELNGEGGRGKKRFYSEGSNGATATAGVANEVATGRRVEGEGAVGSVRWARGARGLRQVGVGFAFAVVHGQLAACQTTASLFRLLCLLVATKAKRREHTDGHGLCCVAAVMGICKAVLLFFGGPDYNLTAWSLTGQLCSSRQCHSTTYVHTQLHSAVALQNGSK